MGLMKPPKNSKFWQLSPTEDCHEVGKYLREKSNGNNWSWKAAGNCKMFFSPNGKLIAMVFYSGKAMLNTTTYILKEN